MYTKSYISLGEPVVREICCVCLQWPPLDIHFDLARHSGVLHQCLMIHDLLWHWNLAILCNATINNSCCNKYIKFPRKTVNYLQKILLFTIIIINV